ncbi:MAG: hypothetical protein JXO22_09425 [Phycisphaerae bacterium]|nr:hypothetical protein [Phycisphaerae bacterium]
MLQPRTPHTDSTPDAELVGAMSGLDLDDVTETWDCEPGQLAARLLMGGDGSELVQLRVDLGVLQMYLDGRPDGALYHGLPSVLSYIQHELRVGRDAISHEHWQALDRELTQFNYRRLACANAGEDALERDAQGEAARCLARAVRDVDICQAALTLLDQRGGGVSEQAHLWPTLVFNRGRLMCQLRVLQGQYDGAIESAEEGANRLQELVDEYSPDALDEETDDDVGVMYLRELARQLRLQYEIDLTLRERFEAALEAEDYEVANTLHAELDARAAHWRELDEESWNADQ